MELAHNARPDPMTPRREWWPWLLKQMRLHPVRCATVKLAVAVVAVALAMEATGARSTTFALTRICLKGWF
jgi:hypothetical protein